MLICALQDVQYRDARAYDRPALCKVFLQHLHVSQINRVPTGIITRYGGGQEYTQSILRRKIHNEAQRLNPNHKTASTQRKRWADDMDQRLQCYKFVSRLKLYQDAAERYRASLLHGILTNQPGIETIIAIIRNDTKGNAYDRTSTHGIFNVIDIPNLAQLLPDE